MADEQIHDEIERLVAEEQELWQQESAGNAGDEERRRLESVKVSLDPVLGPAASATPRSASPVSTRERRHCRQPETVERFTSSSGGRS